MHNDLFVLQCFGLDDALHFGHALIGLNDDVAALGTIGLQGAGVLDFVFGAQADLAVLPDDGGGGLDGAAVADDAAVEADFLADQRAQVDRLLFAVGDFDLDGRFVGVGDGDALAGQQHDLAFGGVNEAGVFNLRGNQDDLATTGSLDGAFILDAAGAGGVVEFEFAGEEVGILELQGGDEQAGDVDLCTLAEGDAVGVDQDDAAIRLQAAEDLAGVAAGDAVEHLAGGALLDEAGEFAAVDVKALPVDDGAWGVGDSQRFAVLLKNGLAGGHHRLDRVGQCTSGEGGGQRCSHYPDFEDASAGHFLPHVAY